MIGLVEHMYRNGLEFAPPEAGGEGAYKTLFQDLRSLYMKIGRTGRRSMCARRERGFRRRSG